METLSTKYKHDSKAFNEKKSHRDYRNMTIHTIHGVDGTQLRVPFSVKAKTPDESHYVNYRHHKELNDEIDYLKAQEAKPRSEREFKERYISSSDHIYRRQHWGEGQRLKKVSYLGAKLLTKKAVKDLGEHNTAMKDAYRIGTLLNLSAYNEATIEDKNREPGLEIGTLVNKNSIDFTRLVKKNINESASIFDKLDLVRERAYEFAGLDSRQYIIKDDTSTIVIGNSSKYVPETWDRMGSSGGYTKHTSSAFKLSVMEADKTGKDKMVIDVFQFNESQNYYYPVSKTTLLENDSATVERYDGKTAQYLAPEKLNKSEVQSMYSHLILGDNILG